MRSIGSTLVLFGVGSIILNLINYEFALLMWIDNWGTTVGWVIRGAMIVAGAALFLLDNGQQEAEPETE